MTRLGILFLLIVMSVMFTRLEGNFELIHPFPFSDMGIILPNYVYYLFVHVDFCLLVYLIYSMETEFKREVLVFLLLSVGDLLDYALRYSEAFFGITYDMVQMAIFGLILIRIAWMKLIWVY